MGLSPSFPVLALLDSFRGRRKSIYRPLFGTTAKFAVHWPVYPSHGLVLSPWAWFEHLQTGFLGLMAIWFSMIFHPLEKWFSVILWHSTHGDQKPRGVSTSVDELSWICPAEVQIQCKAAYKITLQGITKCSWLPSMDNVFSFAMMFSCSARANART